MNIEDLNLSWGKKNRLAQMFRRSKDGEYRTTMLAVDHPYFYGPTTGLTAENIRNLAPYADAISPARGTLEHIMDPTVTTPMILRVTGGNSMTRREELSNEHVIISVDQAVRLNAIGVSVSVYIGTEHQAQTIQNLGKLANDASKYDLLVLGIVAVGAELDKMRDNHGEFPRYLAHAGRIIQEQGADIVKLYYCDGFEQVREGIQAPLVMAGGKRMPELDALKMTYNAVKEGVDGIDMGRNIFQAENPVAMIQAVKSVVHHGLAPDDAYSVYQELKQNPDATRFTGE